MIGTESLNLLDRYSDLQREALLQSEDAQAERTDRTLVCIHCLTEITSTALRSERQGAHAHRFTNPHGIRFVLGCFEEASVALLGEACLEFTWFTGYAWQIANCPSCGCHLGWRFTGSPVDYFFGLILSELKEVTGDS